MTLPKIGVRHLLGLDELSQSYGQELQQLVKSINIPDNLTNQSTETVSTQIFFDLLEQATAKLDPLFAYYLAKANPQINLGELTDLIENTSTLAEAIQIGMQYKANYATTHTWCVFNDKELFSIVLVDSSLCPDTPKNWGFYNIASAYCALKALMGNQWSSSTVSLKADFPEDCENLSAIFDCEVKSNQPINYISFPSSCLNIKISDVQHNTKEIIKAKFHPLTILEDYTDYKQSTLSATYFLLPTGNLSFNKVAEGIGVAPKTLQRRLTDLGTSYQTLVDVVRKEVMLSLIKTDISLSDICWQLGFADASTLTRFCHKIYGVSPSKLRNQVSQQNHS